MIYGNIDGVRRSALEAMEAWYDEKIPQDKFAEEDMLREMAEMTRRVNREICIYLGRDGSVLEVVVGRHDRVNLEVWTSRRGLSRLSGVRLIHTHPGGNPSLSDMDEHTLRKLRLDALAALSTEEGRELLCVGYAAEEGVKLMGPFPLSDLPHDELLDAIRAADEAVRFEVGKADGAAERAALIGCGPNVGSVPNVGSESNVADSPLKELESLVETAGAETVHRAFQRRPRPDSATYIGSGLAEELSMTYQKLKVDVCIVDDEITGAQARNLEAILGVRVVDRTALILDIFAQRARSREGKLQVELAQLRYRLPRLMGAGTSMSRLGGGIGTRGPGERKLEMDRRLIRRRIFDLEQQMGEVSRQRESQRQRVKKNEVPVAALVGYTNAGKSTLLNALCGADAFAEDKLFATLDPLKRRLSTGEGGEVLLVDTVGFIHKLPHSMINAFRSTLEEAKFADLLVHVVDATSPEYRHQMKVVQGVLEELGAGDKPQIIAFNKTDQLPSREDVEKPDVPFYFISAKKGIGLLPLADAVREALGALQKEVVLEVPFARGAVLAYLHENGKVLEESYTETGVTVRALLGSEAVRHARAMLAGSAGGQFVGR